MGVYISMLRGVNVGSNRMKMDELRSLYRSIGLVDVRSYVQSGNVIFTHGDGDAGRIGAEIERRVKAKFGFDAPVFIRTVDELRRVVAENQLSGLDESKLHVTFLSGTPDAFPAEDISRVKGPGEKFSHLGREVYLFCPGGYGRTKLSNGLFESRLKLTATTRNWRTVRALLSLAQK